MWRIRLLSSLRLWRRRIILSLMRLLALWCAGLPGSEMGCCLICFRWSPARSTAAAQPPQQAMRRHPPPATESVQLLIHTSTRLQGPPPPHRAAPNRRPPSGMVGARCRQQHSLRDTASITGPTKESHPQLPGPERARCAVPCIRYPGCPWLQH